MSRRMILSSEDEDSAMSDVPVSITENVKEEDTESMDKKGNVTENKANATSGTSRIERMLLM